MQKHKVAYQSVNVTVYVHMLFVYMDEATCYCVTGDLTCGLAEAIVIGELSTAVQTPLPPNLWMYTVMATAPTPGLAVLK